MAASPPTKTPNDVLPNSNSLSVQQNHRTSHDGEGQQDQATNRGSRSPVEAFLRLPVPNQPSEKPPLPREPFASSVFSGNLLSRPVFKTLELKQGFEYGPPVPIAPGQFTRRICSPAPINQQEPPKELPSNAGFSTAATKPLPPKDLGPGPQLDENATSQYIHPPPPRPRVERRVLPPQLAPPDMPLKKKNDHVQAMAPPFLRSPRAESRTQVNNKDSTIAPTRAQLLEPPSLPADSLKIPTGRIDRQNDSEFSPSEEGQERPRSHDRRHAHERRDTSYEKPGNARSDLHHHDPRHANPQATSLESSKRQNQHQKAQATDFSAQPVQSKPTTSRGRVTHEMGIHEDEPVSRGSNMSKPRSINHVSHHAPISALASSEMSEVLTSSPAIQATRNTHEFSTSMARAINNFNISQKSEVERQRAHYKKKLRAFQRKVDKLLNTIEGFEKRDSDQVKELRVLADRVKALEAEMELKETDLQSVTQSFEDYQDQSAKDADKNQHLLDQFEKRIGELTKEVQALKSSLKLSRDGQEKCEVQVQEAERRARNEQTEKENAYLELDSVRQELADTQHDLELERARTTALEEKLEALKTASKTTETLSVQYDEIIRSLEEHNTQMKKEHQEYNKGSSSKLDTITETFEGLAKTLSEHSDTLSKIESRCMSEADFGTIDSKLEAIIQHQNSHSKESVSPLSDEILESIQKIQKQLHDRQDLLRQQLDEKIEENNGLLVLSTKQESELRYCKAELETERERSSRLETERNDLQETLSLIDDSQEQAAETEAQLEATRNKVVRLQEEMASKDTQIKELQNKLEENTKACQNTSRQFSEQLLKLSQRIHEKDEEMRVAISQAQDVARREVRFDMEREIDKVKKLLHQTQQQRDALSERMDKLNESVARNEESTRNDAITIASLRETIAGLENRFHQVTQEKAAKESQFEQAKSQGSERLEALNAEITTLKAEAAEFKQYSQSQIAKGQKFLSALKQLAEQHGLSSSIADGLQSLFEAKIDIDALIPSVAQAVDQFIGSQISRALTDGDSSQQPSLLERSLEFFPNLISLLSKARLADDLQSQRYPAGTSPTTNHVSIISNNSHDGALLNNAARLLSEERRVVVRSPADFQLEPSPPTVHQEKTRRRQGPQPKSIMKPVTRSMASQFWSPVVPDPESLLRAGQHEALDMYDELLNVPTSAQQRNSSSANSPSSSTMGNENTGSRSRKRTSEASIGMLPPTTRRKRGKKADQKDLIGEVQHRSGPQEAPSGERLKENSPVSSSKYMNKGKGLFQPRGGGVEEDDIIDDDDKPLPRRVLRGTKNSSHATTSTPVEGEDANRRASTFRQTFQKGQGSQKVIASTQGTQLESQEDSQSNHWPPIPATQDSLDFNGGGQSPDDPLRLSPDLT